uniref:uncharacterized protein C20orf85 homolog isoform X2 n=1 Tax=Myodes glareolus TaxID=447135 RepID=UPI002021246B|nr:uncharacterized protein C20orf85 homolog isoform X2 [Myodes glareolus]
MAQQKPLSTTAAERMNLVAQDEIWRYRLKAEYEAQENWPTKWGYLTTSMEKLLEGEEEPHTPKPKIELPSHFRVRPVSPMDKYIKVRQAVFIPFLRKKSSHHLQSHRPPRASSGGDLGCQA